METSKEGMGGRRKKEKGSSTVASQLTLRVSVHYVCVDHYVG